MEKHRSKYVRKKNHVPGLSDDFVLYRKRAIRAAQELEYSNFTIIRLENATTESEVDYILCSARNGGLKHA